MPKNSPDAGPESDHENDLIWGAEAIGAEINRSKAQVYHLIATGALNGVVARLGYKTFVASRKALRNLPFRDQNRNLTTLEKADRRRTIAAGAGLSKQGAGEAQP